MDGLPDGILNARPALASGPGPDIVSTPYGYLNPNPQPGEALIPRNCGTGPSTVQLESALEPDLGIRHHQIRGIERWGARQHRRRRPRGGGFGGFGGGGRGGPFGGTTTEHRYNLTLSISARNLLNHVNYAPPVGIMGSPFFLQYTAISGGFASGTDSHRQPPHRSAIAFSVLEEGGLEPARGLSPACPQCRKCRTPVNTIARPNRSAASITSASRTDPPGWITAVAPWRAASSTPSGNGKKASDPTTVPCQRQHGFHRRQLHRVHAAHLAGADPHASVRRAQTRWRSTSRAWPLSRRIRARSIPHRWARVWSSLGVAARSRRAVSGVCARYPPEIDFTTSPSPPAATFISRRFFLPPSAASASGV